MSEKTSRQQRRQAQRQQRKLFKKVEKDPNITVLVDDFLGVNWWEKTKVFPSFTIYHNTKDFPGKYVVRLWDGDQPMRLASVKDTLEAARATIPMDCPAPFTRIERTAEDDPVIVETWL